MSLRPTEVIRSHNSNEAIPSLKPVTFCYKKGLDPEAIPQFGLASREVAKVDPDHQRSCLFPLRFHPARHGAICRATAAQAPKITQPRVASAKPRVLDPRILDSHAPLGLVPSPNFQAPPGV